MSPNREWMYTMRTNKDGTFNLQFQQVVSYFLDFAYTNATNIERETKDGVQKLMIRCPCNKCKNRCYKTREEVDSHLMARGFMKDYQLWYAHGERYPDEHSNPVLSQRVGEDVDEDLGEYTGYDQMIMEGMHQNHDPYYQQGPQDPNQRAEKFYNMFDQANEPLWEGAKHASTLSITTRLLNWKSDCNVSDSTFDKLLPIIKETLPDGYKLPRNFYETKKMLKPLELPSKQIPACHNHCMLFNRDYSNLDRCRVSFTKELETVYGDQVEDSNELAVWEWLNPNSRFGIGSSDPSFVVTGTPSSFCDSSSYTDFHRDSQEVQNVWEELEKERTARVNLEARLEQFEKAREQERVEREQALELERNEREQEREQERREREQERQRMRTEQDEWRTKMEDMFKNLASKK